MMSWQLQTKLIIHNYDVIVLVSCWVMQNVFQNFIKSNQVNLLTLTKLLFTGLDQISKNKSNTVEPLLTKDSRYEISNLRNVFL